MPSDVSKSQKSPEKKEIFSKINTLLQNEVPKKPNQPTIVALTSNSALGQEIREILDRYCKPAQDDRQLVEQLEEQTARLKAEQLSLTSCEEPPKLTKKTKKEERRLKADILKVKAANAELTSQITQAQAQKEKYAQEQQHTIQALQKEITALIANKKAIKSESETLITKQQKQTNLQRQQQETLSNLKIEQAKYLEEQRKTQSKILTAETAIKQALKEATLREAQLKAVQQQKQESKRTLEILRMKAQSLSLEGIRLNYMSRNFSSEYEYLKCHLTQAKQKKPLIEAGRARDIKGFERILALFSGANQNPPILHLAPASYPMEKSPPYSPAKAPEPDNQTLASSLDEEPKSLGL